MATQVSATAADEVVRSARELRPLLERNALEAERLRRLPDENVETMRNTGLFSLCSPRRFGGYELPLHVRSAVYEELGRACGASAWCASINNEMAWLAALLGDEAQQEVFADRPDAIVACSFAFTSNPTVRRVDGGYLVKTGRFPLASGSWHADWLAVSLPLVDENGELRSQGVDAFGFAFFPKADVSIDETWDATGMSGTGTHTIVIEESFVPDHRILPSIKLLEPFNAPGPSVHKGEEIYRCSGLSNGLMLTSVVLGRAREALDIVMEKAQRRGISYSPYLRQVDSVAFQLQVGDAAMKLETADLHLKRAVDDIERSGARSERLDFRTSSRVQAECGYIATQIREAVEILISAHGAGSFMGGGKLQQIWRDVNAGGRHAFMNSGLCRETYGKSLFGLPSVGPLAEAP